ncbi:DUF3328 domain [Fusarium acutatum]|uniref:DUF3328 domain n=1 Tax=Fusarium acutatum TaxID=78861 RepID=A0A8H4K3L4_9HYPO|nr:DUF3328 domain [Fusarium acutatum]
MVSPFPRQLQLVAYHDSQVERTDEIAGSNGDTVDPITVILVEESKSVPSQQAIAGCMPEKKPDDSLKNQNVISRVFLLPSTVGSGKDTAYSLLVKVDTEAWRTPSISAPIEQPQLRHSKLRSLFSTFGYPTPGSDGPKRQLRILYHNATEWSQKNPHGNGEWKIRMDDQALIPAAAWDPEEERYQAWFHDRYKVMSTAVKERSFIRPSWLGSLHMVVPWDDEFHLAHCVVTLKRYWKAKETGKHVCPRGIAPNHIEHCLNWFEGYAFRPEPQLPKMGPTMAWQTKVCF